jgi:hypothetical protein
MLDLEKARQTAPVLLDELRSINPDGAIWIADVFSEVLTELRANAIKDPVMVEWLMEALDYHRKVTLCP